VFLVPSSSARGKERPALSPLGRRRNLRSDRLDEVMIEKARQLFNVKTDTEAIHKALQKAVEDQEIQESLDRLLTEGRFRTIYR